MRYSEGTTTSLQHVIDSNCTFIKQQHLLALLLFLTIEVWITRIQFNAVIKFVTRSLNQWLHLYPIHNQLQIHGNSFIYLVLCPIP